MNNPNKFYSGMKLQVPDTGCEPADMRNARVEAPARKPYSPPARGVPPAD